MPDSHPAMSHGPHWAAMRTAWSGGGAVAFPAPAASSGFPAKVCDPKTMQFEVVLGSEPARIDITF
jgi:hypothetical protein